MVPVKYWSNHSHTAITDLGEEIVCWLDTSPWLCTKVYMAKDKQMNEYEKAIFSLYFKLLDSPLSLKKKKVWAYHCISNKI